MSLSQRTQYGLRALFELAKSYGRGPIKIAEVAAAQGIPPRFLEVILGELKQAGFVESRRGAEGGYMLARRPATLAVGEVIRFLEGPLGPVACVQHPAAGSGCARHAECVFLGLWERSRRAVAEVYDSTTLADLIEEEQRMRTGYVATYAI